MDKRDGKKVESKDFLSPGNIPIPVQQRIYQWDWGPGKKRRTSTKNIGEYFEEKFSPVTKD